MKQLQLLELGLCAALVIGCETTQTTGTGTQEQKRMAQLQQEQEQAAQVDEADRNLWNAHVDRLNRETNPANPY